MKKITSRSSAAKSAVQPVLSAPAPQREKFDSTKMNAIVDVVVKNFGTVLMIAAAFLIGVLWTEVRYLKKGVTPGTGVVAAPSQGAQQPTVVSTPRPALTDSEWKELTTGAVAEVGNKNAKAVMVEFSDFQCPFCGRHFTQTYGEIKKQYVDTGKLRIIFRDLPLPFHPNAKPAAVAARCVGEQGKYMEMHDMLFTKQTEWSNLSADAAKDKFVEYSKAIAGVNGDTVSACIKADKYAAAVDADSALASKYGANGTPSFYVNKKFVEAEGYPGQSAGAAPLDFFKKVIDAAL